MSVQEIEQAIAKLESFEIDELAKWLDQFRSHTAPARPVKNGTHVKAATLAEALGPLIGAVGHDQASPSSSRDSGTQFTDHLVDKKREHRF